MKIFNMFFQIKNKIFKKNNEYLQIKKSIQKTNSTIKQLSLSNILDPSFRKNIGKNDFEEILQKRNTVYSRS